MSVNIKIKSAQDTEDVRANLINTIKDQLSGRLNYQRVMNIKGILGITLDDHEVVMIDIEEVIRNEAVLRPSIRRRKSSNVTKLRAAEINNRLHTSDGEEIDEDDDSPSSKLRRCDDGSSSGRSSVDTQSGSCASLSVSQPQRFVQNPAFWCPESDASGDSPNGTIIVEPSAVYEDQLTRNDPNTNGHEETTSSQQENTQTNPTVTESLPSLQGQSTNDAMKDNSNPENALHKHSQQENGPSTLECNDEPINLSRSVSRDGQDMAHVVKKEPEEQKPVMSMPMPLFPSGNGTPESDIHCMWLRNMADKKERMVLPQPAPMMLNHVEGLPFPPALLDPQLSLDALKRPLPHHTNPFVLNTPQLQPPNNIKKRSRKAQGDQSCSPSPPQASSKTMAGNVCNNCGSGHTSTWRRSENGELVCNACGLYFKLHKAGTPTPPLAPRGPTTRQPSSSSGGQRCSNCDTGETTMWRRNMDGEPVCNACGLYYKLHQVNRPKSMVKTEIHSRKRKPRRSNAQMASENAMKSAAKESSVGVSSLQDMPRMPPFMHVESPLSSASLLAVSSANALSMAVAGSPPNRLLSTMTSAHVLPAAFTPTTPNSTTPATSSPTTPTGPVSSNGPGVASSSSEPGTGNTHVAPPSLTTPNKLSSLSSLSSTSVPADSKPTESS